MYAHHEDTFALTYAAPARKGVLRRIAAWLERWKQAREANQAMATLVSLDAHLLRDIGATRGDLSRLVREGRR